MKTGLDTNLKSEDYSAKLGAGTPSGKKRQKNRGALALELNSGMNMY